MPKLSNGENCANLKGEAISLNLFAISIAVQKDSNNIHSDGKYNHYFKSFCSETNIAG